MFVDETKIQAKAGKGGDGCFSLHRGRYLPKGGPDGGDGGRGGDVYLVADRNVSDLTQFKFNRHWKAKNGAPGQGAEKTGGHGDSIELKLPVGTVVYDMETGRQVADLTEHEQTIKLLTGGDGGLGNVHFKSSTNQTPQQTTPGELGQEGEFKFVLKTIADVGLVGFPNAGKSSLLELLTNANPKTAPYPFTTLNPIVGVLKDEENYQSLTLADIPGLIEGAADNRGLGHRFLKHIERCDVLLIMLDMAGTDGRDPLEDFLSLLKEIELYDKALAEKPYIVAGNKMDEPEAEENVKRFKKKIGEAMLPISILSEEGIPELIEKLFEVVNRNQA